MRCGTDFDPKGTISEVRPHAGPHLEVLDADQSPNADSPRSSRNRLIIKVKEMFKKDFQETKKPELPRRSVRIFD